MVIGHSRVACPPASTIAFIVLQSNTYLFFILPIRYVEFQKPREALEVKQISEEIEYLRELDEDYFDNLNVSRKSFDDREAEYARIRDKIRYSAFFEIYESREEFEQSLEKGDYDEMVRLLSQQ